jgi:hypothetical protein
MLPLRLSREMLSYGLTISGGLVPADTRHRLVVARPGRLQAVEPYGRLTESRRYAALIVTPANLMGIHEGSLHPDGFDRKRILTGLL